MGLQDGLSIPVGQVEGMLLDNRHILYITHFGSVDNFPSVGSYGSGKRIKLAYTRRIIDAIHSGSLLNASYKKTEVFGLEIPTEIEGVPSEILDPVNTVCWLSLSYFSTYFLTLQICAFH
jgi:hypothetical protein